MDDPPDDVLIRTKHVVNCEIINGYLEDISLFLTMLNQLKDICILREYGINFPILKS